MMYVYWVLSFKMMKYSSIIIILLAFLACKKEEIKNPDKSQTIASTTKVAGVLNYEIIKTNVVPSTTFSSVMKINARFYSPEVAAGAANTNNTVDAGTVTVNGYQLKRTITNSTTVSYMDTTELISNFPITYSLNGSSVFTITTFTNSLISTPSISNFNTLPSFISKATALTFTLADAVNVKDAELLIHNIPVTFTGNVVNVPVNVLSTIPTATFINVQLKLLPPESSIYVFNGKNYSASCTTTYLKKNVYVTP